MKKLICLTFLLGIVSLAVAQNEQTKSPKQRQKSDLQSPLQSMVDTELAFARMSEELGTRPSFMAFIADDGILFRPRAVKGKQWMTEHPLPQSSPSDKRPLLSWYPIVADIALAGDMGYTTGPWEYKADLHDAKPVAWGNFLTVWKKQSDGSWKFAIDLGISNSQPAETLAPWQVPQKYKSPKAMNGFRTFDSAPLLKRDREFSKASAMRGAAAAFVSFAAEDVRVFRDEKSPFIGMTAASAALPATPNVWTWEPAFGDVSKSDDLGYTYGTYKIESHSSTPKIIETGNYFRVWKKEGNKWLVVGDLTNPVQEDQKN
jgi:ketosteroid isomerase-like protein